MPSDGRTASHKLNSGDLEGLVRLIGRWSGRESQAVGGPVQVVFAYEAGYDGFWLYRRLTAEGIRCQVMDPASLPVNRRARRVKTDVVDVAMLLRALMAWWRGDRAACRMVQVPTLDQEDARRTHRERRRLITERVQHVNRTSTASRGCCRPKESRRISPCEPTGGSAWMSCAPVTAGLCRLAC